MHPSGLYQKGLAQLRHYSKQPGQEHDRRGAPTATGNLPAADEKLVILKTDGTLILARLSPTKYQELAKATIFTATTRALPALASGRLYTRDGRTLKRVDLGRASK